MVQFKSMVSYIGILTNLDKIEHTFTSYKVLSFNNLALFILKITIKYFVNSIKKIIFALGFWNVNDIYHKSGIVLWNVNDLKN